MATSYKEYKGLNMPAIEQEVFQQWKKNNTFDKSITNREGSPTFVFYEGPPSANGMPGIHHAISRTLKDMVCRYKTMQGFQVLRKAGWDTHGLPVELGVEKQLGITKEDIGKSISVEDYNQKCRTSVMQFTDKWDELTQKMGYWVDLQNPYITYENNYIESLWWALKELFKKDLLYKSVSIQPYSPAAGTGLSSHELNQPGTYRDVKDTSATVLFKAINNAESKPLFDASKGEDVYFMAWTTTPWTLPSNLALTVGPKITYCLIKTYNSYTHQVQNIILAENLIGKYLKVEGENAAFDDYNGEKGQIAPWKILVKFTGTELAGMRYEQLFKFESNKPELTGGDPFRVITGDFVTTEDGTGIVHTAPAFGADDYKVAKANNIGIINLVDREGKFVEGTGVYAGRFVKDYKNDANYVDVNVDISVELKQRGQAFKVEKYEHSYPHCWRTDKPIIYYPLDAWFIRTTALKDEMVALNKTINWKPQATGEGRFGNWLENMVDWNLSRSRFWGTPLPIWTSEDGENICIGSVAELRVALEKSIAAGIMPADTNIEEATKDLHRPYVDNIVLVSSTGKPMHRETDLIDVWFDSGAMPFAQWHFPFENVEKFAANYPADFIAEGVDQTRGWFYTLHALGSLLKDSIQTVLKEKGIDANDFKYPGVAYKSVIANGLVLDKNGNKMSKRLGNAVDPFETIEKYSADATRWYLITNASPWDSLKFDIEGIKEVQRKFFGTIYNTYQFFALYANVDGFAFKENYIPIAERPEMDRWILSALNTLAIKVNGYMDDYEPTQAGRAIETFVDEQLSNWYVRLCRRRFWKGEYEIDKIAAYQTLYECLEQLAFMMAPISPFFADWLYQNLNNVTNRNSATSIHLANYPKGDGSAIDKDLEERMQLAQDISSLVLSLRKKVNIKVRQPLQKILVPVASKHIQEQIEGVSNIILSEVNIKEIEFIDVNNNFISKKIKPNFKTLGAKLGAQMKGAAQILNNLSQEEINKVEMDGKIEIEVENNKIEILKSDLEIIAQDIQGWSVANKDQITVALDISLSEELIAEGIAREIVNRIQKIRKDNDFNLTDKINLKIQKYDAINSAILKYNDYIRSEILANEIIISDEELTESTEIEVNDLKIKVLINKT
jgi:isoleucyl-tRNA synthetase